METPNPRTWSELPHDLLRSIFEQLSFTDFHRAKSVCSNWNWISKQTVPQKIKSPWLMLFPDGVDGCVLYNPDEDRIYKTVRDFSGIRFLANSGNWFLVVDSRSNLSIIDVFSEDIIDLPPLESVLSHSFTVERLGDNKQFKWKVTYRLDDRRLIVSYITAEDLRGLLWVDEKTKEFVVVWFFVHVHCKFLAYYKKGDDHYSYIYSHMPGGINDIFVLQGYFLYIALTGDYIRFIDLSKQHGFEDITGILPKFSSILNHETNCSIVVTTSGEVLVVKNIKGDKSFPLYKWDPHNGDTYYQKLVKVDSLTNEESVFPDLGITVAGIEPNSIYFTGRNDIPRHTRNLKLDICVFNYVTKTLKRFPSLSNMKLKDARWFLPQI